MHIYFIRHGETEYNRRRMHQNAEVPLSERGRAQIERASVRLKDYPITKIISSDYVRARESAGIISPVIGLTPEESPLFREVKRSSELYGHSHYSTKTLKVGTSILRHLRDPLWHYSDEENLYDLKKRVAEGVAFLEEVGKEHEHIAVVSHAFIISLFIKYMCSYKDVRVRDYMHTLFVAQKLANASISTVVHSNDGNPLTCDWMCIELNGQDHLKGK